MPTVQDEEESLCLLAADLQDLPPRDQMVPNAANTNWTTNDDDDDEEVSLFTFFSVCTVGQNI